MAASPFTIIATSTATYTSLLALSHSLSHPSPDAEAPLKAISSLHATVTTGLALAALAAPWPVDRALPPLHLGLGRSAFDDAATPLIAGRSALGNAVTAWEAGYLLFDSLALVWLSRPRPRSGAGVRDVGTAVVRCARDDPFIFVHHTTLFAGLAVLQYFISHGRERGVWVVVAFVLMNASTPLLNLRWWVRKRRGRGSLGLDAALAAAFAGARLGSVWWVLREYGRWHSGGQGRVVGVWEAFRGQRWVCQVGTGALVGLNGLWLGLLVSSIGRRVMGRLSGGGGKAKPPR